MHFVKTYSPIDRRREFQFSSYCEVNSNSLKFQDLQVLKFEFRDSIYYLCSNLTLMSLLKRAIQYTKPYRSSFFIAIVCNFMYAIFNVLALAFMMPILNILFDEKSEPILEKPVYSGKILELKDFASDYSAFFMQQMADESGPIKILLISCVSFIILFFFRNIFSYMSEFF